MSLPIEAIDTEIVTRLSSYDGWAVLQNTDYRTVGTQGNPPVAPSYPFVRLESIDIDDVGIFNQRANEITRTINVFASPDNPSSIYTLVNQLVTLMEAPMDLTPDFD